MRTLFCNPNGLHIMEIFAATIGDDGNELHACSAGTLPATEAPGDEWEKLQEIEE